MLGKESVVCVIDDDPSFCRSTKLLLESGGFSVQTFGSAEDFFHSPRPDLPGVSGARRALASAKRSRLTARIS